MNILCAPIERVIRTDNHLIHAYRIDQRLYRFRGVDQGVEPDATQVFAGCMFDGLCFRSCPVTLIAALQIEGQITAAVGRQYLIFPVAKLIAYLSSRIRLMPGDILITGSPSGSPSGSPYGNGSH
ncbi:fumarylacetoacetate hydrolase family protein [Marinobacterium sp. YM272]|uniref:fumarylacetoacetate hydrolase family protein n=1 Tax=Marinobacterium sp. YM272 TaxID=3421654 RepID=UPI003D7F6B45